MPVSTGKITGATFSGGFTASATVYTPPQTYQGTASFSGAGGLTANADPQTRLGTASFDGAGGLTADANVIYGGTTYQGTATFAGVGEMNPGSGDAYTVSLLHFNGSNGSTSFTDDTGKTWTAAGNAQLSTTSPQFGSASLLLDGTGDYAESADNADWDFGTGDFTVECWVKTSTAGFFKNIVSRYVSGGAGSWYWYVDTGGALKLGGTASVYSSGSIALDNTWQHVALQRVSDVFYFCINGTVYAGTGGSGADLSCDQALRVGENFNGYIDEVRVSKGVGRYPTSGTYTVPSAEFSAGGGGGVPSKIEKPGSATFSGAGAFTASATVETPSGTTWQGSANYDGIGGFAASTTQLDVAGATFSGVGGLTAYSAQLEVGSALFAGAGSLSSSAALAAYCSATFAGVGSLSADAAVSGAAQQGSAAFAGVGALTAYSAQLAVASASFAGAGALDAAGRMLGQGAAAFAGIGGLSSGSQQGAQGAAEFSGQGAISAEGTVQPSGSTTWQGAAAFAGLGSLAVDGSVVSGRDTHDGPWWRYRRRKRKPEAEHIEEVVEQLQVVAARPELAPELARLQAQFRSIEALVAQVTAIERVVVLYEEARRIEAEEDDEDAIALLLM